MVNNIRLREERERLGHSQDSFGVLAGVTKQSQHMYESGKRQPDMVYMTAIAQAGADVLYILTGQRTPKAVLSAEEAALLDNYNNATEQGKAAARAVLDAVSVQKQKAA